MKTPAEYLNKNKSIIPCIGKKPIIEKWQDKEFKLEDFKPGQNIGLKLKEDIDVDIDTQKALPFVLKYIQPCSAVYGRGKKSISHYLFKGKAKHKKFALHKDLEAYFKGLDHEATIIECRSGGDKQSIAPGSIIEGEEVKWKIFEGISPYPGDIFKDVSKVAFAAALSILYPPRGNRDDYCYAIACILAKYNIWKDYKIDEFIEHLAEHSGDDDRRKQKGTHAFKQLTNGGKTMGFPKLTEILGLDNAQSIYNIFEWVGVNPPDKNLEELKKKIVHVQDSASMYNVENQLEQKKEDFNNDNLYYFPGTGKKKKAFESLMTDFDFFHEKKVIGRAVLPGYDYPIAEIDKKHFYLKPGRYLNLYPGPPIDPVKGDVSDWVNSFKLILGEDYYEHIEQYYAALIQKIFKYLLNLTPEESEMIGPMKIQWGYLLVGPEGTGKKALAETLQRIIGRSFVDANARYDEIIGNHSEVIYNKLFIFINEVVTTGDVEKKTEISNKLKPFWTDEDSKINPKHIRPFRYWNNANGMCFSNEQNCLHLGRSSRRYGVLNLYERLPVSKLVEFEKNGTFEKIYKFIQSDKIKHLFHYFLHEVKVKDWKLYNRGRAPVTDALKAMQDEGQHPIIQRLTRALDEELIPFDRTFPGFVVLDDLLDFIRNDWKTQVNEKYIKDWLRETSFKWKNGKQTRQILNPTTEERPRVWLLQDNDYLRSLSETELGSAPGVTVYEHELKGLKYKLSHSIDSKNTETKIKQKFLKKWMKILFGNQWSATQYTRYIEEILIHLYKNQKDTKEWFYNNHQSGWDGSYNIKTAITERRNLRDLLDLEEEKYINALLSDKNVDEYEERLKNEERQQKS